MSHLSILPTVLRDPDLVEACLESMGFQPRRDGVVHGFGHEAKPVDVELPLARGLSLGWCRQPDGSLAMVGDVQRLSRCHDVEALLTRLTRAYAARDALRRAQRELSDAVITLGA